MGLRPRGLSDPAQSLAAVTPADSDLPNGIASALYIGSNGGTVVVIAASDSTPQTFSNVPAGFFPVSVKQVRAATTATNIIALY